MANTGNAFGLASLYDPSIASDQTALDRKAELAKLLRMQSIAPVDTANRQIGGMAYKISPLEGIAKLMQGLVSKNMDQEGDAARQALTQKQATAMASALRGMFGDAPTGSPAAPVQGSPYEDAAPMAAPVQSTGMPQSPQQSGMPQPVGGDSRRSAALSAMLMGNQDLANKLISNELEQTPFMKDAAFKGLDPKQFGAAELAAERAKGLVNVAPGNDLYDPVKGGVAYAAPEKAAPDVKALGEALTGAGIAPDSPEGRKYMAELVRKQTTHQPANTVTVNADKTYTGNVAEGIAKQETGIVESAMAAPDRIAGARRIKDILTKNPITGTSAEGRLAFDKALATAGFKSGDRAATTESLAAELAGSTLDAVKTSGLGAGQGFTDKDREFLERAKSGNIQMQRETIQRLADLNEKAATATVERANKVIAKWKTNPALAGMAAEPITIPKGLVAVAPTAPLAASGLSAAEQSELAELRKRFGK